MPASHWSRRSLTVLPAAALIILMLPLANCWAGARCATDGPESVLACCSRAYSARSVEAWGELLAPDFTSVDLAVPEEEINREEELAITANLFKDPALERVALEWGDTYRIVAHEESRSWELHEIPCTLTLVGKLPTGQSGKFVFTGTASLWVREVTEPERHYLIYRMQTQTTKAK